MIDNFDLIKTYLKNRFWPEEVFYFVQLIQRAKDIKSLGANNRVVKSYYVNSLDYLNKVEDEIIKLCKVTGARAYINLSPRSYKEVALQALKATADRILNKQDDNIHSVYDSVCGKYKCKNRLYLIDIDEKIDNRKVNEVVKWIDKCCQPYDNFNKFKLLVPTKSGWHLIMSPFDVIKFNEQYPSYGVQTNNPTILYIP